MATRILIIEDDGEIADSLVRGLSEEGFVVSHHADGASARVALRSDPWDLIILDWWLPGSDGLTLLQEFRRDGGDTPVLFLTARDAVPDRVRGLDGGADDYMCKPFDFDELLARIRALVRRAGRESGVVLSYRDLRVDLIAGRAERGGKSIELTHKEVALLVYFLRHVGRALSSSRIYEGVWGEGHDALSDTLKVHVGVLRRKLEAHGPRLIHTLRGRGYMFGDPPETSGGTA